MDVCSLEEIQNLFIFYDTCFSKYFPELEFYCIEMKQEYVIYLPLSIDAKFRILTKQKTYYS